MKSNTTLCYSCHFKILESLSVVIWTIWILESVEGMPTIWHCCLINKSIQISCFVNRHHFLLTSSVFGTVKVKTDSISQILLWEQCKRIWFYQYVLDLSRRKEQCTVIKILFHICNIILLCLLSVFWLWNLPWLAPTDA